MLPLSLVVRSDPVLMPIATFWLPVTTLTSEPPPSAKLLLPVVTPFPELTPINMLPAPVVTACPEFVPIAMSEVPVVRCCSGAKPPSAILLLEPVVALDRAKVPIARPDWPVSAPCENGTPLIDVGVIAPSVKVIAGVVVDVATVPETPFAVVTETLVTVPEPPDMVLQPKPVPDVHVSALDAPEQEGTANPEGVVAVKAPRTVLAEIEARLA